MSYVLRMGLVLVALAMLSLLTGFLAGRSAAIASAGFAKNLRRDIFKNVQRFSFSNIDKFSTASLITRLTTDVTNVQNAYQVLIRTVVRAPVIIIFALIFSMSIDMQLSLIFLGIIPVLGVGLALIIAKAHPIFVRVFSTYDKLNNVVQENLRGIRVVKSFIREDYEKSKFARISQLIYEDFTKAGRRLAYNMPLMQFSVYACMLLLSWLGAKAIVASGNDAAAGLSTGELTSLITYTMQILMSLMLLSIAFVMIIISRASAQRIAEVLAEKSDLANREPCDHGKDSAITFENETFSIQKTRKSLCDGVSSIAAGETVGILGGTGSASPAWSS